MQIIEINASNFCSFESLNFAFTPGTTLISGKNGSGKSTIFDALFFALSGKSLKKLPLDAMIQHGKKQFETSVIFKDKKHLYKIYRKRIKGKTTVLQFTKDGKKIEGDINDIQKQINKIINPLILETIIIFSGRSRTFFELSDKEQKDILVNILFGTIDFSEYYKMADTIMRKQKNKIMINKGKISILKKNNENLTEELISFNEYSKYTLIDLKTKLKKVKNLLDNIDENISENSERILEITREISKMKSEMRNMEQKVEADIGLIKAGKCPLCGSVIDSKKFESRIINGKENIKKLKKKIKEETNRYEILDNEKIEYRKRKKELYQKKDLIIDLISTMEKIESIQLSIEENTNMISKLEKQNEQYKKMEEIYGIIKKFFSPNGITKDVFLMVLPELNKAYRRYSYMLGNSSLVYDKQWYININGKMQLYKSLSSGEKRIIDMSVMFALFDIYNAITNVNTIVLDEVFDPLDSVNTSHLNKIISMLTPPVKIVVTHHALDVDSDREYYIRKINGKSKIT